MPGDKSGKGVQHDIPVTKTVTVRGKSYTAATTNGIPLMVWVGDSGQFERSMYFCHGHALGTYAAHRYTVYSTSVWNVLHDEYDFLGYEAAGTPQDLQVGDVVAWFMVDGGNIQMTADLTRGNLCALPPVSIGIPVIEHTCVITHLPKGLKRLSNIVVSSKNGFADMYYGPVAGLLGTYPGRIGYFRRSAPALTVSLSGPNSIFNPSKAD